MEAGSWRWVAAALNVPASATATNMLMSSRLVVLRMRNHSSAALIKIRELSRKGRLPILILLRGVQGLQVAVNLLNGEFSLVPDIAPQGYANSEVSAGTL